MNANKKILTKWKKVEKSGKKNISLQFQIRNIMLNLIGEFECSIGVKGRIMLPLALKKQLPTETEGKFIINRGFEKYLVLYPKNEWKKITDEINILNLYSKKNREFVRYFYRGASEIVLDSTNRLLFPKSLREYACIKKDIVLFAFSNRIEVWAKEIYQTLLTDEPEDFASLAEDVMAKKENEEKNNDLS